MRTRLLEMDISIIPIAPEHNKALATIIRAALEEFGANKPGTVYFDDSTDHLYELFSGSPQSFYFVALDGETVVGDIAVTQMNGSPLVRRADTQKVKRLPVGKLLIGVNEVKRNRNLFKKRDGRITNGHPGKTRKVLGFSIGIIRSQLQTDGAG
jgi:hypothetical protein